MNANDHNRAKRLDDYIDALNAGRPVPPETDDAELAALYSTARDLHRLRAAGSALDDVPSRLAAALERELRADQSRDTRRIENNDMSQFRDASSNGSLRPPDDGPATYALPHRPERARQWMQFFIAGVAFVLVGVVLAQILGGGLGDGSDNFGSTQLTSTPGTESTTTAESTSTATVPSVISTTTSITPTATVGEEAGGSEATPDETGSYRVATFDEAQPLTPFELVKPATVPEGLALEGIRLWTATDQTTVETVTASYRHDASGEVQFWQTLGGCIDGSFVDVTNDEVEIGDKVVRRLAGTHDNGDQFVSYTWQASELCYTVVGTLTGGISEETLTSFVASVPTLDAVIVQTPPAGPAFPGPEYATLSVSPDYVTCEDEVIARGMGFAPGTTVVIHGGQLPGDNFGPVTDDIAVGEDGSFETLVDLTRLIGECRGADIQMGGMLFRLGADTGSTQTKEDEEGPSASTVIQYRYEGEVPDIVKHREWLPTCGTEVWIEDTAPELSSDPDIAGRQCFVDAVSKGMRAEFVSLVRTGEGWFSKLIYRSLGNNIVETFADTSGAKFVEIHWSTRTCTGGAESVESDLFAIRLLECSEQEPIE